MSAWGVTMSPYNFLVCGPKFTEFCSLNVEGIVVDKMLFRFATCRCIPEIFAIKVESYKKSRQILDVFSPWQILGGGSSKSYTHVITPVSRHVVWKMFCGDTPTSPEVIVANTLSFKPNFKFSRLHLGGPPVPVGVCAR